MPLLYLVLALIAVAMAAWLNNTYLPMEGRIKTIANVVLALLVVGMVCGLSTATYRWREASRQF
jgi:hypothetical protein